MIELLCQGVYSFPRAAVTKDHTLGGLGNRKALSHSSGGCKSAIKVSAALVASEGWEGEPVSGLFPSF